MKALLDILTNGLRTTEGQALAGLVFWLIGIQLGFLPPEIAMPVDVMGVKAVTPGLLALIALAPVASKFLTPGRLPFSTTDSKQEPKAPTAFLVAGLLAATLSGSLLLPRVAEGAPPVFALARFSAGAGAGVTAYESAGDALRSDVQAHASLVYNLTSRLSLHATPSYGFAHDLQTARLGGHVMLRRGENVQSWAGVDWITRGGSGRHDMEQAIGWGPYVQVAKILNRKPDGSAGAGAVLRAGSDFENGPYVDVFVRYQFAGGKPRP